MNRKQANDAIDLCLKSAEGFVADAKLLLDNKRPQNLPISLVFAFEEIGKSAIVLEKLRKIQGETIILKTGDGIYDHHKKIEIAANGLDLPQDYKMAIILGISDDVLGLDPITITMIAAELRNLKETANKGHYTRLSTFVDFDYETGNPRLGHDLNEDIFPKLINSITSLIYRVRNEHELMRQRQ